MRGAIEQRLTHSHADGHFGLGDSVHRTAHERRLQSDIASDLALRDSFGRSKGDFAWQHQKVVVGEATMCRRVHELVCREAVAMRVRLQILERLRRIEIRGRRSSSVRRWHRPRGRQSVTGSFSSRVIGQKKRSRHVSGSHAAE